MSAATELVSTESSSELPLGACPAGYPDMYADPYPAVQPATQPATPVRGRGTHLRAVPASTPAPGVRPAAVPDRSARVLTLHRPSAQSVATPVRLTRRGVVVLGLATVALAVGLVALAWASAPSTARSGAGSGAGIAAARVTVRPGDTLWSIAGRVAPQRDPRAEVYQLQQLNHLTGSGVSVGQRLRVH